MALSLLRQQLPLPGPSAGDLFLADHFAIGLNPAAASTEMARFQAALHAAADAPSNPKGTGT